MPTAMMIMTLMKNLHEGCGEDDNGDDDNDSDENKDNQCDDNANLPRAISVHIIINNILLFITKQG